MKNNVLNKDKSAIPLFNGSEFLFSASDNANFFEEIYSENSNLNDSGRSVFAFPCRTNQKIYISATPKMVKKVLWFSSYWPEGIPVVGLMGCTPKLSYVLADLSNMELKKNCFQDCWKVLSVVHILKNVRESYVISLLSSFLLIHFEKLLNNRLVDNL